MAVDLNGYSTVPKSIEFQSAFSCTKWISNIQMVQIFKLKTVCIQQI